jgi:hypothetical protein
MAEDLYEKIISMTRYLEGVLNGKIEIQKTYYSTQAKAKAVE